MINTGSELVIYDCGHETHADAVIDYMSKNGFDRAKLILSHNDSDHFDGILKLLKEDKISVIRTTLLLKYKDTILEKIDDKRKTRDSVSQQILDLYDNIAHLGPVSFALAGYRPLAMGIFLLMFTPLCMKWGIQEGISVNTVLMTHILAEGSMGMADIANEALLLFVGTGVGVVLNLYIPGSETAIRSAQGEIEETFISLLSRMASELGTPGENGEQPDGRGFQALEQALGQALEQGERRAYEGMENSLLADTRYYLAYMGLRKNQFAILCRMRDCFSRMESTPDQALVVADLLQSVSGSFHERNNALGLLDELEQVKLQMKAQPLPVRRQEFESRALLYLGLLELEQFLVLKKEFALGLSRDEIRRFWGRG